MNKLQIMSQTTLADAAQCKVTYNQRSDMVVLEIGATSLKLDTCNFMMMNEMIRKAAARLVMETSLKF